MIGPGHVPPYGRVSLKTSTSRPPPRNAPQRPTPSPPTPDRAPPAPSDIHPTPSSRSPMKPSKDIVMCQITLMTTSLRPPGSMRPMPIWSETHRYHRYMLDLVRLRVLAAVAAHGSVTAAAESLH